MGWCDTAAPNPAMNSTTRALIIRIGFFFWGGGENKYRDHKGKPLVVLPTPILALWSFGWAAADPSKPPGGHVRMVESSEFRESLMSKAFG